MSNLKDKFKEILMELEGKLETENDKKYSREAFSKLLDIIENDIDERISNVEEKQKEAEFRVQKMDEMLKRMQDEFFIDDEEDEYEFEISCPYCNHVFDAELDELKKEIKCPECNNIIELDWSGEDDECSGECSHCSGCDSEEDSENFSDEGIDESEEDDDM